MNRFLAYFSPILIGLLACSLATAQTTADAQSTNRPNVLFIAIDDLRPELGAYGAQALTPNIDRLAGTGMRFDRAYCQQAVCGASRLSIMGGLYPTNTREQNFHVTDWRLRHPDLLTINQHFGAQGYNTIGLGKIYHGVSGPGVDPDNWNRWVDLNGPHYFKQENIEALRAATRNVRAAAKATKKGNGRKMSELQLKTKAKGPLTESVDVPDDTYLDGQRATTAVDILKEMASKKTQPFFLAVGFTKPHLPFVAPKKYWDLYQREDFRMPSNRSIPPGYPKYAANLMAHEMCKYSDCDSKSPAEFSEGLNRRLLHGYAASTSYVDACVGRVLEALEKSGAAKNTIVVLWGDHGWKLGDHSSWVKHTNFECDTRVPLIVRDPRIAKAPSANTTPITSATEATAATNSTTQLVELIDLYPTLCDLTGLPTPPHCQGRSFRALLSNPRAVHRDDAYSSYLHGKMTGHSLRFANYRFTQWRDVRGQVAAQVLTDLEADPGEETNVISDPVHADALAAAMSRIQARIDLATDQSAAAN